MFHAIQTVRQFPSDIPFMLHVCKILHWSSDYQEIMERREQTQCQNLMKSLRTWKSLLLNGVMLLSMVFTESTKSEIDKLKIHARKGCLSDIAVGGGTNRNEAFHRYVNTFFHKGRIGILLSYALMMTIIHQYNSRNHHSRKSIFKPLQKSQHELCGIIDEPIGIYSAH